MRFLILRLLTHSELGMFHEYRRQKKEGSKQRAVNFDWDVVDRVFPAAKDTDRIEMDLRYDTDHGVVESRHWLKRQEKNWRLEGNCPTDKRYDFVEPGCLFAMEVDSGVTPGKGCWAVFPAGSSTTQSIFADGESGPLARSSMIALHREEGEHTWQILSKARPDLFSLPKDRTVERLRTRSTAAKGVELAPNPKRLVQLLAAVGHTMPSAVADLVDNAISADATQITITFGRPDNRGRWLSISDNGAGMDSDTLAEAMRIGSDSEYDAISLGKYGFGLKGASWSQTNLFMVVTRTEGNPAHHLSWDTEDMDGWIAKSEPLEAWEAEATAIQGHGTVVLWKNMRPPQTIATTRGIDPYSAEVMDLDRHLGLVFHRFIEGKAGGRKRIAITINGKPVEPNNPVGHPLTSSYDAKTVRIPTETAEGRVKVQAFLLPTEDEINAHEGEGPEAAARAARARDLIGLHGKRNETQGLFIYRHDRLIKWGGWHQMWETNDEKTKLARVVVDFDKVLDESFKINISKQIVHLPMQLQVDIKNLAGVARGDSQRKYRRNRNTGAERGTGTSPAARNVPVAAPAVPYGAVQPARRPPGVASASRVAVKFVETTKFIWKVTRTIAGGRDVQVSGLDQDLRALVQQLADNPQAVEHLADFLGRLDEMKVQALLLGRKTD